MKKIFRSIWEGWKKVAFAIGNTISFAVLSLFYVSIFALFAIPYKVRGKDVIKQSGWRESKERPDALEYFEKEH